METICRQFSQPVELRDGSGELPDLIGLAAPFHRADDPGTEFDLWAGAVERIMPTAFDQSLSDEDDIYSTFNHNSDNVVGRVSAGTLRLQKTARGLEYAILANDESQFYRELVSRVRRGDVRGSSISFAVRANGVEWVRQAGDDEPDVRELHSVRLIELGPVVDPAYKATDTGLRAVADIEDVRSSWQAWQTANQAPVKRERAKRYLDTCVGWILRQ